MRDRKRRYLAYLLRLWQVRDKGQVGWRASIENVHTGERRGFASPEELFAFLEARVSPVEPAPDRGEEGGDIDQKRASTRRRGSKAAEG